MSDRAATDDRVFAWFSVLDALSYYELFEVPDGATPDELRRAFHAFCDSFHPDRHIDRPEDERAAIATVFKRGTEAYLVLTDAALRARYDEGLRERGTAAPPRMRMTPSQRPQRPSGPPRLEDSVRSPTARPFARRAEELLVAGDLRQAKLQLVMASHMDAGNVTLESALRDVEARLAEKKK